MCGLYFRYLNASNISLDGLALEGKRVVVCGASYGIGRQASPTLYCVLCSESFTWEAFTWFSPHMAHIEQQRDPWHRNVPQYDARQDATGPSASS
jgi:hypothetical protein